MAFADRDRRDDERWQNEPDPYLPPSDDGVVDWPRPKPPGSPPRMFPPAPGDDDSVFPPAPGDDDSVFPPVCGGDNDDC